MRIIKHGEYVYSHIIEKIYLALMSVLVVVPISSAFLMKVMNIY